MGLDRRILFATLAAGAFAACGPAVPPEAVSWQPRAAVITPASSAVAQAGGLRVETDTDLKEVGGGTFYNVRRSYSIYSPDGKFIRRVDNRGGRSGEQPVVAELPPGHYVVATMYGTLYRRVNVDVENGEVTRVSQGMLGDAAPVFTQIGRR
jgi:hypothetical protein